MGVPFILEGCCINRCTSCYWYYEKIEAQQYTNKYQTLSAVGL